MNMRCCFHEWSIGWCIWSDFTQDGTSVIDPNLFWFVALFNKKPFDWILGKLKMFYFEMSDCFKYVFIVKPRWCKYCFSCLMSLFVDPAVGFVLAVNQLKQQQQ